ncbi:MAG: PAS domain-containing sensor histidine kinase [Deltaproteobacteria bacterium]|nr:PAS domain-containing sensor histidine kinase [Deltaproteobacteria bacterium]
MKDDGMSRLRLRAKEKLKKSSSPDSIPYADVNKDRLIEEMKIQQTELQLQNEELKKLREDAEIIAAQYRSIYEFAPIGYVTLDPDGRIVRANLAAADLVGVARSALDGSSFASQLASESVPVFNEFFKKTFRSEKAQICEVEIPGSVGKPRIVEVHGRTSPDGASCLVTLLDVTRRRQAEDNLRAGEARYRELVEHAASAIIRWKVDGTITYFNEFAQHFFGYSEKEIIGKRVAVLLPEQMASGIDYSRLIEDIVLDPERYASNINENISKDGSVVWMNWTNRFIYDAHGQLVEVLAVGSDITELKRAEALLVRKQQQLEEANRELESFSYSVSHDLQAPLRAIDGYTRMILKHQGGDFDEETSREFEVIRESVKKMGQLINDLLAFSRLGKKSLYLAPVQMTDLVKETWDEVMAANPDRTITFSMGDLPSVRADRALLKQALVNLLANAAKFSSSSERQARVEAGADVRGNEIVYFIRDNGIGFDMAYRDKLFNIFATLHDRRKYGGTGVGLAIAQRIIIRHGGKIWAEGKVDEGATFYFTLPASETAG